MGKSIHASVDVRGALTWKDRELVRFFKGMLGADGQRLTTAYEIRRRFVDVLADGWWHVPFGKACEGFDPKSGCPGHDTPDETDALKNSDLTPAEVGDGS